VVSPVVVSPEGIEPDTEPEGGGVVPDDFWSEPLRPMGGVVSPEGIEPSTYRLRERMVDIRPCPTRILASNCRELPY
jgi:hypothetical protein